MNDSPLIVAKNVSKTFIYKKTRLFAVDNVSLVINKGETLGLVGESGCGKSTLGKLLINLEIPSSGSIIFEGRDINTLNSNEMRLLRRKMQVIFQDPYASLDPRMTIEEIVGEGIDIHKLAKGAARQEIISSLLQQIGLDPSFIHRYPHEFSGGQRQRIGIARALAVDPSFIVCDEPLSALDVCTQQQVMQLLLDLKSQRKLTYLFISHDLNATRVISDHIAVMYLGKIVEKATTKDLFSNPKHPYTQALLSASSANDPFAKKKSSRIILKGELPSPLAPPSGCPFHPRCPIAQAICKTTPPPLIQISSSHSAACHFA